MHHNPFVKYRPDIDGLRAVAVLSVVVFHAFPKLVPGGFIGVDIFFVISGYLISSIVLEGAAKGRFSFLDFYSRRARRIFPALSVVLVLSYLFGWAVLFRPEFEQLGFHIAAGAGFVSNFALMREVGYFDTEAELKPLLHLWSLAIEEQFYLVWPIMILIGIRLRWNLGLWICLGILLSLATSIVSGILSPDRAFYLPFTRFWELMIGGYLASRHRTVVKETSIESAGEPSAWRLPTLPMSGFNRFRAPLGFLLVVLSLFMLDSERTASMSGWWAVFPTFGAALIISAGPKTWVNLHVLGARPLVSIGLISYPLYLWHWPLLALPRVAAVEPLSGGMKMALILTAVGLSFLTYRFLEIPVRRSARPIVALGLTGAVAGIGIMGFAAPYLADFRSSAMQERDEFVRHFDNREYGFIRRNNLAVAYRFECDFYDFLTKQRRNEIAPECISPIKGKQHILLWGDSHAQALSPGIRRLLPESLQLLQVATSGCSPNAEPMAKDQFGSCNRSNRKVLDVVAEVKPELVIIAQRFQHEGTDWPAVVQKLKTLGAAQVILLGPVPQWEPALPVLLARRHWGQFPDRLVEGLRPDVRATDEQLKAALAHSDTVRYISLFDSACTDQGCLMRLGPHKVEDLMYWDYGHLTGKGAMYFARESVLPAIQSALPTHFVPQVAGNH